MGWSAFVLRFPPTRYHMYEQHIDTCVALTLIVDFPRLFSKQTTAVRTGLGMDFYIYFVVPILTPLSQAAFGSKYWAPRLTWHRVSYHTEYYCCIYRSIGGEFRAGTGSRVYTL